MGTPEFAVPTLKSLINSKDHQVVAVFTQSPKSKGRGLNEIASPIHSLASKYDIPTYTPETLRTEEITNLINSINADIIVVVAYGFLIPQVILQAKKYGCLNIHPSSLPRHRGAAPLQRTIIEGDSETSVCIMQMDEGWDTGDIILQHSFSLSPRITLPVLHDQCAEIGADLLVKTLDNIDNLPKIVQDKDGVTYAHKLKKEEGKINWYETAYKIDCRIRGMNPWPGIYFEYRGKAIKILEAYYNDLDVKLSPGTVVNNSLLEIACGKGTLVIKKLQLEGRKALNVEEFIRGVQIPLGTLLD
ncbi:MAG: methionyl-tRNA formyltransferase [Rickettsia endosymbiont of Sergentomyia squamirostris]|uniref:Methionyl-tRNA formyltransferase n=1 Tax=Candidatus Tisiphia endosymbiont of Sergentomyia squamirostris TaxID=3113639 RepID=A0AAT9G7V3_9RICK